MSLGMWVDGVTGRPAHATRSVVTACAGAAVVVALLAEFGSTSVSDVGAWVPDPLLCVAAVLTMTIPFLPMVNQRLFAVVNGIAMVGLGWSLWRDQRSDASAPASGPASAPTAAPAATPESAERHVAGTR